MSPASHDQMLESGLLGGPLHAGARAAWPDWAREHFDGCDACRALARADELARTRLPASAPRPRPDPSALRKRLDARRAAPIEALAGAMPAFSGARWRAEPNATSLELRRTPKGVRASDPEATHLLLFAVTRDEGPRLLGAARQELPGVAVDADWAPSGEARAVAIGARAPLDASLWQLWLSDRFRGEWPDRVSAGAASDRLHLADLEVRAVHRRMLRIVDQLPPTTEAVTALLRPAAVHGRTANNEAAARGYAEALELARRTGDVTGEIKATLGLATALYGLGHTMESQALLTKLATERPLDRAWGALVCRQIASHAMAAGDLDEAARWLDEAEPLEVTPGWLALKQFGLAVRRRDDAAALAAADRMEVLVPELGPKRDLHRAWALAGLGRAQEIPDPLPHADHPHPDVILTRLAAAARADGARGKQHWPATIEALARLQDQHRAGLLLRQDLLQLLMLLEAAREQRATEAALLLRLQLLDTRSALDPSVLALCAIAGPRNALVTGPAADAPVRDLPVSVHELRRLVATARAEAATSHGEQALRTVLELLLPDGIPEGEIAVASDGALADLPAAAVLATGSPAGRALPAVRIVTRPDLGARRDPEATSVASLADAAGDLPEAAAEVLPHEALVHLRGAAATFEALATLPPVGLLHLGLHGRRAHDVAELQFADRVAEPADIGALRLLGGPVVLLSGCATAHRSAGVGVERSLADAFLRAGASAVIATAWNYDDAEMSVVVRALLSRWPFASPSIAVSQVVNELRNQGKPRRTWAGLVVYQTWPSDVEGGRDERNARTVARLLP